MATPIKYRVSVVINDGRERDYKSRKEQERSRDKERSEARKNKRREW